MAFLKAIIYPSYWFTHQHPVPQMWVNVLTVLFAVLAAIGFVAWVLTWRKAFHAPVRTLLGKIAGLGLTMGIVGGILLFCSVQQVAFLSARVVYLVWGMVAFVWLYRVLAYAFFVLPKRFAEQKEREQREKYLPKAGK